MGDDSEQTRGIGGLNVEVVRIRGRGGESDVSYPGDGWQGGQLAPWAARPAGRRGPGAGAGQAAEGLAWQLRSQEGGSGAELSVQFLHCSKDCHQCYSKQANPSSIDL